VRMPRRHATRLCPRAWRRLSTGPGGRPRPPLYKLLESLYERVKGCWEERFEGLYGFWRGLVDGVVARYLDCGILHRGFAPIRCPECQKELLLAFSCKGRGLCPSCGAKRATAFAAFLRDEVVADVGHAQWVFTAPSSCARTSCITASCSDPSAPRRGRPPAS
jgi:hypothetical protein